MDVYDDLGVKKLINGYATVTVLGGSLMPRQVMDAMAEASRHFVDIDELQERVGARIASWTRNEAAYVSSGAAAALALTTAACIAGVDPAKRERLPVSDGMRNEIIIHRCFRVGYDFAIRQAGGRLVEIGDERGAGAEELERAISDRTAAVFYFYNPSRMPGHVPLADAVRIAHARGVSVIVDAAAQIPPVENLWMFTGLGADAALFSGGKGLRGPQSSGLIVGKKELIRACAFHACPRPFIGRPMKAGKEEIVGLMAAVRLYLDLDHKELMRSYEEQVRYVVEELRREPHLSARRDFPSEAGQPMPRALLELDERGSGLERDRLLELLRAGEPGVALAPGAPGTFYVNPQTLEPGEVKVVVERVRAVLRAAGPKEG